MLGLGIFFLPVIFVWFLLRDGHTKRARIIGFVWLALASVVAINKSNEAPAVAQPVSSAAAPQPSALEQMISDIPACNSDEATESVIAAVENGQLARVYGISVIKIRDPKQVASSATEAKCTGTAVLSSGEDKPITYRFYQDGEDIMTEAEIMGLDDM